MRSVCASVIVALLVLGSSAFACHVSGAVYCDENTNGVIDVPGDLPIPGVHDDDQRAVDTRSEPLGQQPVRPGARFAAGVGAGVGEAEPHVEHGRREPEQGDHGQQDGEPPPACHRIAPRCSSSVNPLRVVMVLRPPPPVWRGDHCGVMTNTSRCRGAGCWAGTPPDGELEPRVEIVIGAKGLEADRGGIAAGEGGPRRETDQLGALDARAVALRLALTEPDTGEIVVAPVTRIWESSPLGSLFRDTAEERATRERDAAVQRAQRASDRLEGSIRTLR